MSFQVIVRELKPLAEARTIHGQTVVKTDEQIYEQTVEVLDLGKLIAAVNHKPRVRKPRTVIGGSK